jgi:hypothetical protein
MSGLLSGGSVCPSPLQFYGSAVHCRYVDDHRNPSVPQLCQGTWSDRRGTQLELKTTSNRRGPHLLAYGSKCDSRTQDT